MRGIRGISFVSAAILLAACSGSNNPPAPAPAPTPSAPADTTVRLIAFNDFHGNIDPTGTVRVPDPTDATKTVTEPVGGAAYFSSLITQLKQQNPLNVVIGAGDMVSASPLQSALFHDESTIQVLNQMGLEFTSVGNHEFDHGMDELLRQQNGGCYPGGVVGSDTCLVGGNFSGAQFQYLAANVTVDATGETLFPGYAIKSFDVGNDRTVKIGFIGLVLKETPTIVTPAGVAGLTFTDEADAANALVPVLQQQGVNAIVVLIHQGIFTTSAFNSTDCAGANGDLLPILDRLDPAIRLVVSGHTHQAYLCHGQGTTNTDVYYTSAGAFGRFLSAIDVTLDGSSGAITDVAEANSLTVNDTQPNPAPNTYPTLAPDSVVQQMVARYDTAAAPLANRVIGSITADITRTSDVSSGASGESALGDVIADAQLVTTSGGSQNAVVAFMNPGGIRADLQSSQISGGEQPGEITYGEAFTVQPFGNSLVTLTLTGAQIKSLLEQQFPPNQTSPRILQVSQGFSYTYDFNGPDNAKVDASSIKIKGVVVDPAASYRVTMNSFLASGGDKFTVFVQGTDMVGGAQDIDALTDYFAANTPVAPGPQDRITRLN